MMANIEDDGDLEQADVDAMDQDLLEPSDNESGDIDIDEDAPHLGRTRAGGDTGPLYVAEPIPEPSGVGPGEGVERSRWGPSGGASSSSSKSRAVTGQANRMSRAGSSTPSRRGLAVAGTSAAPPSAFGQRMLPANDETPTRPRVRSTRRR